RGIASRRKAIEVEGIGSQRETGNDRGRVAEGEGEHDPALLEADLVQSGQWQRPPIDETPRVGAGDADPGKRVAEVRRRQRMGLDRNEIQPGGPARILAPGRQGGEEVRAEAEAELEHRESLSIRPALAQAGAADEDDGGLVERARRALVDIAEA